MSKKRKKSLPETEQPQPHLDGAEASGSDVPDTSENDADAADTISETTSAEAQANTVTSEKEADDSGGGGIAGPDDTAEERESTQVTDFGDSTSGIATDHEITTQRVIEAILFASESPLKLSKIVSILGVGSAREIRAHIQELNHRYEETGAAFRIEKIADGYQMLTLPAYNTWVRRLRQTKQESKLSPAALETLAIVAYKQPVVRAEVEAIRGVSAGEMLNRLRELGLVKIVGRAEDVGRPMLYGTTRRFLEAFGLSGLEDLPAVEELQPPG